MGEIERFHISLNRTTSRTLSEQGAADAFQNLTGFMNLLIKINEREQIVPIKKP
jgi:hypothetical protein